MPRPRKPPPLPTTALQELGLEIRHWRERRGLSIADLASHVGRDRRTILGAEDGRDRPSEATIRRIEEHLNSKGLIIARYEAALSERRGLQLAKGVQYQAATDASILDASSFIDETIADGTLMEPGERFEKSWTIRNVGVVDWKDRYLLRMGAAAGAGLITTPERVALPRTAPGELVTVVVPCVASYEEGTSCGNFKMSDSQNHLFFPGRYTIGLQVQIVVRPIAKRREIEGLA